MVAVVVVRYQYCWYCAVVFAVMVVVAAAAA